LPTSAKQGKTTVSSHNDLPFRIMRGADAREANPFLGDGSDRLIVSVDTLASPRVFARLAEDGVTPYDLVVFDEAHKLAADRSGDLRVRKTDRYRLAEAIAGASTNDDRWHMGWSAHHLLLLTATPHMGKDYPYYALWRLLDPDVLSTPAAFDAYPAEMRRAHFIRRTKEEMTHFDGRPLYPTRISDTLAFDLSQGPVSEQALYDETTSYLKYVYNRARILNREAARLAMGVFQRRLASSTYALLRSFERRIGKLQALIEEIQGGRLSAEQLARAQEKFTREQDVYEAKTADDESVEDGREENEVAEEDLLGGVIAASLADLQAEREQVEALVGLARKVLDLGHESKFEKLREVLTDPRFSNERLIVFTEHRDTLEFLSKRLAGLGYTGQVAQIHGGMDFIQREEEVERFRTPVEQGGARFLICTDAAGEGINLQFCWVMVNYDVPWNPARLEQRMGRIHRYGQQHDPVLIVNLVAPSTREGKVLQVLLEKLEIIRKEMKSDKVFDCVGRVFQGVSIREFMELAVTEDAETVTRELDGRLTAEQVRALAERDRALYGSGGDVAGELPRLRQSVEQEVYRRLLPGYVRHYLEKAAPLVGIEIDGDIGEEFSLRPARAGAMDRLLPALDRYPRASRVRYSVSRSQDRRGVVWLHPGEPVFESFRAAASEGLGDAGSRGAVMVDPDASDPYLVHVALLQIIRGADSEFPELAREESIETRLVAVRQNPAGEISPCPVEHILLLGSGAGLPPSAQRLAAAALERKERARAYLADRVAGELALDHVRRLRDSLAEREALVRRGFDFQEAELAASRALHAERARSGNQKAALALEEVKRGQRELAGRRDRALAVLRREPELISGGRMTFVAHALVVPSFDSADMERHQADVEMVAMRVASAFEEAAGALVQDVHTPELARAAGLPDSPGFDLLSLRSCAARRAIEVKGRAGTGEIEVSANEWARACNMREAYWLYAVYDCATARPRLVRVQDPFGRLLARAKGSMLVSAAQVAQAAEQ